MKTVIYAALAALSFTANVSADYALVTLYHDNNCQDIWYQDEINGDSCSNPGAGFSSMIINNVTSNGDINVYSAGDCDTAATDYNTDGWTG
ncbi:MAG: hypothetical protein Q9157_002288 [Trypethelium eluteriae]